VKEYFFVLKNYTTFSGRASRREYWMFTLISLIISLALALIEIALKINPDSDRSILGDLYSAIILIPTIAVAIRRVHDSGKSGWWILVPIYSLILSLTPGDRNENKYGPGVHTQTNRPISK